MFLEVGNTARTDFKTLKKIRILLNCYKENKFVQYLTICLCSAAYEKLERGSYCKRIAYYIGKKVNDKDTEHKNHGKPFNLLW